MITNQHEIREITSFCLSVGNPQASKSGIFKIYTLAKPQKWQCSQKRATYTPQKRFRASSKFSISVGDLQASKSGGATPRNDHKPTRNSRSKLIFRWGPPWPQTQEARRPRIDHKPTRTSRNNLILALRGGASGRKIDDPQKLHPSEATKTAMPPKSRNAHTQNMSQQFPNIKKQSAHIFFMKTRVSGRIFSQKTFRYMKN